MELISTKANIFKCQRWILLLFIAFVPVVHAQWQTQTVDLEPGWNSVYLTVQPVPSSCSELFEGLPVESVSWWNRATGQAEFDSDPQQTFPRSPNWRNWYAADAKASTFGSLIAGESYIIIVDENAAPFSLAIKGVPRLGTGEWLAGEYGLSGLPVKAGNTLTFGHFFGFTDEINPVGQTDIYKLNGNGTYASVFRPASEPVEYGKAYWIKGGAHNSAYYGPLDVTLLSAGNKMDFSASFNSRQLRIENRTAQARNVTIRHLDSEEPPPGGGLPSVAGKVPLNLARRAPVDGFATEVYAPLPDTVVTNIPAGESLVLKVVPSRSQGSGLGENKAWQSILQVTDEGNDGKGAPTVCHSVGVYWDGEAIDHTGLWVGAVTVTHVSRAQTQLNVSNTWDHTEPTSVVQPYVFRSIIHLDNQGHARLLQRVLPAWIPNGEIVATGSGIQTNGTYELFTDESYAEQRLEDNPQARITRISSANLPLMDPVLMTGTFGGSHTLECDVELPFDDPVNPFVHRFHPMHDNKEYSNSTPSPLGAGDESPDVTRTMSFAFAELDPGRGAGNPLWGVSELGGTFTETVDGLNKTIYVQGQFRIQKINETGVLKYLDQF